MCQEREDGILSLSFMSHSLRPYKSLDAEGYRAQAKWSSLGGLPGGGKGGEVDV